MSHELMLTIDGRDVGVPAGATLLEAARRLGISIPTLCHRNGLPPGTSCMVCVVEIEGTRKLVPACAYPAKAGLAVRTDTPAVQAARRTAVELLMTEHVGDCEGPCRRACPANMDIPLMIRHLAAGRVDTALDVVLRDIALPSVLGRICPAPCEKACRRARLDAPVSICLLKRFSGDSGRPAPVHTPPPTGRRVAIVGAGPAGLSAAFFLRRLGHTCEVFDDRPLPGGTLRASIPGSRLPPDVLDRDIEAIRQLGVAFHPGHTLGRGITLPGLRAAFDAVILAIGAVPRDKAEALELPAGPTGIPADRFTCLTPLPAVFAIGSARRPLTMAVRAGADGKACAFACHQLLSGQPIQGEPRRFNAVITNPTDDELRHALQRVSAHGRIEPAAGAAAGLTGGETRAEAARCLHCDCRKATDCRLREAVEHLGAGTRRFTGYERHPVEIIRHPDGLVFEPGKCIKCGLCIRLAGQHPHTAGLTFTCRGFRTRVSPPVGETIGDAVNGLAGDIAAVCPTGALTLERP